LSQGVNFIANLLSGKRATAPVASSWERSIFEWLAQKITKSWSNAID
jgi:hypothetical protein